MGNNTNKNLNKKISRKELFKINQRKRRRISLCIILLLILSSIFIAKKTFTYFKCKDISTAVEYLMTTNVDNAFLRVKNMELKFSDGSYAVVEAFGLSKEKPHTSQKVECHLIKKNNIWKLNNSYLLK